MAEEVVVAPGTETVKPAGPAVVPDSSRSKLVDQIRQNQVDFVSSRPRSLADDAPQFPEAPVAPAGEAALEGNVDATTEQRLKDTQKWGHEKAKEAKDAQAQVSTLATALADAKTKLTAIYSHPDLAPLALAAVGAGDNEYKAALEAYKAAPNEDEAVIVAIRKGAEIGRQQAITEVEKRQVEGENRRRAALKNQEMERIVTETVSQAAPDVPLRMFWACAPQASAECPPNIVVPAERSAWQITRAIELAREEIKPRIEQAQRTERETTNIQRDAAAVMPGGGGSGPAARAAEPTKPLTMVEQMNALREKQGILG